MTRATTTWLLDIDGVVNALARGPVRNSWPAADWAQHVVRANIPGSGPMVLPILVAQPVLDFVAHVHASGAAEVVWHSTWREAALSDLAPALELPALPVSVAPEWTTPPGDTWWKLPAAQRVVAAGRRLVWTDDDITVVSGQVADLAARDDTLLIGPDPSAGLTPEHLAAIADFLGIETSAPASPSTGAPRRRLLARLRRS